MNYFPTIEHMRSVSTEARQYPLPDTILSKIAECIEKYAALGGTRCDYFLPEDEMKFKEVIIAFLRERHYGAIFVYNHCYIAINW